MTAIMAHRPVPTGFRGMDRRAARRQRVLKGATLSFNSGYSTFECVVRNLSKEGAQLSLAETFGLPARFRLLISGEEAGRMVRVAWCKSDAIGVSFEPARLQTA
jgi:hypothetical protein